MSVISRLIATNNISQRKAPYRQRIPESSCVKKETADIDILVTSRNSDWKIMTSPKKKGVEPVELVLKNIYQSKAYRKYLS